jgi:hypothetical protein
MALVVSEHPGVEPLAEALLKKAVGEIFAPKRSVADTGFGHRSIEVQHAHQPRPGAAPIGHCQNGTAMCGQPRQHMVAVLPDRFGDDQRCAWIEVAEDFHAHFLRINETVVFAGIETVGADEFPSFALDGLGQQSFHFGLDWPALLVGGKAEVATGHEISVSGRQ